MLERLDAGTRFLHGGHSRRGEPVLQQGVQADLARAEDKNDERSDQESVRSSGIEFVRDRENRLQSFAVLGHVSHDHVHRERERGNSGEQPYRQKNPAEEFQTADTHGLLSGHGQIQAGKKSRHFFKIVQLAPAALHQLPTPVKPHGQQKRRAQVVNHAKEALVQLSKAGEEWFHSRWQIRTLLLECGGLAAAFAALALSKLFQRFRYTSTLRVAEPPQCRPILKPLLHQPCAFTRGNSTRAKRRLDRLSQCLPIPQRAQTSELLSLNAPEIHRIVYPVHGPKNISRL